ncbi:ATP-binding cassette domain-containing protein [Frankia sp. CNm7]|uniref:ATP-binding cassette domain-containing protein n=1 Tax=Frankia nepalensis TaxID=1836974 RepID=A0A937RTY4_9ACTN|nr:ATP-binding cassette domain-containing protein [Frankia nepalensis]MBL7499482.1 ATP-binding cassette domain-containing protein [Frankia nepalensis]MBL7515363.1 ATP-binding cassette domain-containing protein [Frankia nepalensis]MBL7523080.1 ATP-binding cassette domain-containing protein [Frankia nepalensis]MBL7631856.1 ATP-binding cassette domain-containing protein [Frankia nepalensis]
MGTRGSAAVASAVGAAAAGRALAGRAWAAAAPAGSPRARAVGVAGDVLGRPYVHAVLLAGLAVLLADSFGYGSYHGIVVLTLVMYAIAALGLDIPVGASGVLSIGHGAAFAVGMYAAAIASGTHSLPVWVAVPIAFGVGAGIGLLMAIPAGRLGGLGLAVVSLGFTVVLADVVRWWDSLTGGPNGIPAIVARWGFERADGLLDEAELFYLTVILFVLAYLAHWYFRSATAGRSAVAAKCDAIGAGALGISVYRTRLLTFTLGSGIGAVAGAINGYLVSYVSPASITVDLSFLFLVMVVLGGAGSRIGAVLGAVVIGGLPIWLSEYPTLNVVIYASMLLLVVRFRPAGVIARRAVAVRLPRPPAPPEASEASEAPARPVAAPEPAGAVAEAVGTAPGAPAGGEGQPVLRCEGVTKRFGGLVALDGVTLSVMPGEVVAIVGPNGSGKTTFLNVLSGFYPLDGGTLEVAGSRVEGSARSPLSGSNARRRLPARAVARTFQTPKIFGDLSVAEHLHLAARRPVQHRGAAERAAFERIAFALLDATDLPLGRVSGAADLSHGQLRFLEIAVAVSRAPRLLLLDEPATGLGPSEIELLAETVRSVSALGCAVLLVEHHLELVHAVADRVVVLHLGELLWTGPPESLGESDRVRDAYLGVGV